ncbi:MAG: hypothetical protein WCC26_13360 [Terracidiphilus sp.]
MAKVTLVFAVLLVALGLVGYLGTGSEHPTALIPTWFGLALGVFGFLAISPNEGRRKLFMHINVTIGLLGFLGVTVEIVRTFLKTVSLNAVISGAQPAPINEVAMASKLAMACLLLIYVVLCVRSFVATRRTQKV